MIQVQTPQQLQLKLLQQLDGIDSRIARESITQSERRELRSLRLLAERIETLWRSEIHSLSISLAARNHINAFLHKSRHLLVDKDLHTLNSIERLCNELVGPRKVQPVINKIRVTKREQEILHCISIGMTSEEISHDLHISLATVKSHLASLYRKLEVTNRTSAIAKANKLTIIT